MSNKLREVIRTIARAAKRCASHIGDMTIAPLTNECSAA